MVVRRNFTSLVKWILSTTACSVCQFQVVLCHHKYFPVGSNCAQSALQAQLAACSIRYGAKCIVPWNMFQLCYSSRWIITSHQTRKPCLMMFDHDVQYLENAPLVPYLCCMPNLHQQVHEAVQSTEGQCLNACLWLLLKKRILNCKSASLVIVGAFSEYLLYNPITSSNMASMSESLVSAEARWAGRAGAAPWVCD